MSYGDKYVVESPFGGFTAIYRTWFPTESKDVVELLATLDEKPLRFETMYDFTRLIQTVIRGHFLPWAKTDIVWMKEYIEAAWAKKYGDADNAWFPKEYASYRAAIHSLEWIASDDNMHLMDKWFDLIQPSNLHRDAISEWGAMCTQEAVIDNVLWWDRGNILETMTYVEELSRLSVRKKVGPYGITHDHDEKTHWRGLCTYLVWNYFRHFVKADLTKHKLLPDCENPTFPLLWDSGLYVELGERHLKELGAILLNHKSSVGVARETVVDPLEFPSPSI